jgi:hypothetical protein
MRAHAAGLDPVDKRALRMLMAQVLMELHVELGESGSDKWQEFQAVLNQPSAVDRTAVVYAPSALGADSAFTADQLA